MNDVSKVVEDIKTQLFSINYKDPKMENIRQNLTYDIIKYLNKVEKEHEKEEKEEEHFSNVSYKRSSKAPIVPTRYRLLKERKK